MLKGVQLSVGSDGSDSEVFMMKGMEISPPETDALAASADFRRRLKPN